MTRGCEQCEDVGVAERYFCDACGQRLCRRCWISHQGPSECSGFNEVSSGV